MNTEKIRKDFPVLSRVMNKKTPVYLDSACMSLKPKQVLETMNAYYTDYSACAGRSNHKLGVEATENYEKARKEIAKFISAKPEEIIFTKNTTEGINLVSHAVEFNGKDTVVTSDREHNSNLIPWQMLDKKGVKHRVVKSNPDETFNLDALQESVGNSTKLVSVVHVSNIDGYEIRGWSAELCRRDRPCSGLQVFGKNRNEQY
ncbi:MAG: aminotransferase class V-fold PLP-dependent enzyme [Ignavibacteriae bacterium]|nr:aminotransferase class V-fold PLP-dependent enzyme [Ignavibacteriota bacterium]